MADARPALAQTAAVPAADEAEYDAAFQEMLRKPSDLDVLFKFAMIASKTGDLEGAISALERMLRLVVVTPGLHKVHHSRERPETDSNYASLLSVWDRLFGSLRLRERPEEIRLGLDGFDGAERQTLRGLFREPFR